jgi:D-aspartate ligase
VRYLAGGSRLDVVGVATVTDAARASRLPEARQAALAPGADVGAVVIGGGCQGLGIARSLGRQGIPVCLIDDEISIARASRFVQDAVRVRDLRSEQALLDALALARGRLCLSGWVLYPTREENVASIAAHRDELRREFRVPTPGLSSIRHAWDKREVYGLAERLSIPVPRTWFPRSEEDVAAIEVDNPVVVKPAIKEHFFYATHAKAWRANTAAELLAAFRRAVAIMPANEVIVQEMIPGGGEQQYAYCAFFRQGRPVASMTVRRRRQHPSDFGVASTYVETISLPELADPSCRFLAAIDYYGLVELEYKRDPRDGVCKLLDVNARTWGYHSVGGRAGVDFPYLLFLDQIGAPVKEAHARPGVRWIRLSTDVPNAVRDIWMGRLRPGEYVRSLRGVHTEAVFSINDPLPGLYEIALLPFLAVKRGLLPRLQPEGEPLFRASHPFTFFDYFRVPYEVRPPQGENGHAGAAAFVHTLTVAARPGRASRSLMWVGADATPAARSAAGEPGCYRLDNVTFFGRVAPDAAVLAMLGPRGRGWRPAESIQAADGRRVAAIWRDTDGNVFLPFDPGEVMRLFWSEGYREIGRSAAAAFCRAAALRGYYLARPVLPRPVQLTMRRLFARVQAASPFPRWPVEDSLHNFYDWLFAVFAELAGAPVPFLSLWPDGRSWALVLTHDVENAAGYRDMGLLRAPERARGYRSSWNFVGGRYQVDDETVRSLHDDGCEIGVHGLRHDGRDLAERLLDERLPAMWEHASQWSAVGFRSPATHRNWELMHRLGFDYDSSYTDTDPYEPQPGGCCSFLPYFNHGTVELPITLPQDHTLFTILQQPNADLWLRKAQHIRDRGGMVLMLTHPDYAHDQRLVHGYQTLLGTFADDGTAWRALPREVTAWWRGRAASTIRGNGDGWRIEGPVSGTGRVCFAGAGSATASAHPVPQEC